MQNPIVNLLYLWSLLLCRVIQMLPVHCSVISFIIFWIKYAYSWKIEHRGYMPHTLYVWYIVSMMLMWDKRREKEKYQGGRNVFKTCARFHFHALQRCQDWLQYKGISQEKQLGRAEQSVMATKPHLQHLSPPSFTSNSLKRSFIETLQDNLC